VTRNPFWLLCLLFLFVAEGSGAQTATPNTWIATSSTGLKLMGTWTADPGPTIETVTGTWTLVDPEGRTMASGQWSAAKSSSGWSGAWRAVIDGSKPEYTGTWRAGVDLKGNARFADLFEKAVQSVVSGSWRTGRYKGTWSIRAFK
jgi:hypothetical protein